MPRHLAIVMDGNGRWAQQRGLPRSEGHIVGARVMVSTVRLCRRMGIRYLTLYAFSAQNWSRPALEVRALMRILLRFLRSDAHELVGNGVRLRVLGDTSCLPEPAQRHLRALVARSRRNDAIDLCLALSYGGREEIAAAAAVAARAARAGILEPEELTPERFRAFMAHPAVPDPDLVVRTSGEMRLSNFLLWQAAYSELVVLDCLWPEFDEEQLLEALARFAGRERRFGKTSKQIKCAGTPEASAGTGTSDGGDSAAIEDVATELPEDEEACLSLSAIEALQAAALEVAKVPLPASTPGVSPPMLELDSAVGPPRAASATSSACDDALFLGRALRSSAVISVLPLSPGRKGEPVWRSLTTVGSSDASDASPSPWLYAAWGDDAATRPLPPAVAVARVRRWGLWLLVHPGSGEADPLALQRAVADSLVWSAMALEA
ncbi:hypothetical protein FNF28_04157 [Cafeteria roenbergensis]|uniref:Alkyl transferase n=1 Tax=Cafeteria roenbergensis TaxID=33653 RepID=A0A5A8DHK4_CAFRO|nr:hypothetical protein FNF28_04157 [Cafeteria roenbergensis]